MELKNKDGMLNREAFDQGYTVSNGKGLKIIGEHNKYAVISDNNWKWYKTIKAAYNAYNKLNK